jgi:hypothetical protein
VTPLTRPSLLSIVAELDGEAIALDVSLSAARTPRWPELRFEHAVRRAVAVQPLGGKAIDALALPGLISGERAGGPLAREPGPCCITISSRSDSLWRFANCAA